MFKSNDPILGRYERRVARALRTKVLPSAEMRYSKIMSILFGAFFMVTLSLLGAAPSIAAESSNKSSSQDVQMDFKPTPRAADGETEQEYTSCENIDVNTGNGDCADTVTAESSSESSTKAKVVSVNGVSIHSDITVLARIRVNGTPERLQTNCHRIDRDMSIWTSYDASGTTGWHWKFYRAGKRFCLINGAMRDPVCHNKVQIGRPKSNPPKNAITGKVKFVKRIVFKAVSVSKIHEKVVAKSKSWCNTAHTHAYGEGRGAAEIWARGRAVLKGHVKVSLFAAVNAASQGDLAANLEAQGVIDVKGQTKSSAFGKAVAESSSKAVCEETEQVTCPEGTVWNDTNNNGMVDEGECNTPPPSTPAPNLIETDTVNDVLVNNTRTITVKGSVAPGHTATLVASAKNGGSITQGKTQTVSGNFTTQITYMAPSEVPGAGNGVAAGRDQVEFTLTQDDGQYDTISTNQFVIMPRPATP